MKTSSIIKRHFIPISLGACALISLCMVFASSGVADASSEALYDTNADGLTYGSAFDAPSAELEPDLIEAVATNGAEGYVRQTELDEASQDFDTVEEGEALMEQRNQRAAELLAQELSSTATTNTRATAAVTSEDTRVVIDMIREGSTMEVDFDDIASSMQRTRSASALQAFSADQLQEAFLAVEDTMTVYIPVYEQDGKTVVGQFPVSQF